MALFGCLCATIVQPILIKKTTVRPPSNRRKSEQTT
jgi:hypothetical protein